MRIQGSQLLMVKAKVVSSLFLLATCKGGKVNIRFVPSLAFCKDGLLPSSLARLVKW